jgi:putative transcriptional regulator
MSASPSDLVAPLLLMAMPQVLDRYFHRSVVLLLHHEDAGSFGFIVNRPTKITISEILKEMDVDWGGREEAVAYLGGPVQTQRGTVLFGADRLPEAGNDSATEVIPGVALTQHVGDLSRLAESPPERFRLLLGYAGWGEGQLVQEILRNDWLTAPVRTDLIFARDPQSVWADTLRSVGVDPEALPAFLPSSGDEEPTN